ncbi:MAG: hypothetical protein FJX62_01630 [Alphaproteobacteria bacterium]|nr:hypothetical protein [Alphaproteobacteria bacterium]
MRTISLAFILYVFWLVLSGYFKPFLLIAGAICAVLCALAAGRLNAADEEGHPNHLILRTPTYYPWLLWEIAKSAWSVTKIILHPKLPISPTMSVVRASQRTAAGIATYANSITLTPGTITADVQGNDLTIHALVADGATDVEGGEMDRRVRAFEGGA